MAALPRPLFQRIPGRLDSVPPGDDILVLSPGNVGYKIVKYLEAQNHYGRNAIAVEARLVAVDPDSTVHPDGVVPTPPSGARRLVGEWRVVPHGRTVCLKFTDLVRGKPVH